MLIIILTPPRVLIQLKIRKKKYYDTLLIIIVNDY